MKKITFYFNFEREELCSQVLSIHVSINFGPPAGMMQLYEKIPSQRGFHPILWSMKHSVLTFWLEDWVIFCRDVFRTLLLLLLLFLLLPQVFIQDYQFKICNIYKFCSSIRSCNDHEYNKGGCVCSNKVSYFVIPLVVGEGIK